MFVSFLAADARRVGQGGRKRGEATLGHAASLNRDWNIWDAFPDWCGDLVALEKRPKKVKKIK